jgi:hypothetical protein
VHEMEAQAGAKISMRVLTDLADFLQDHRPHGRLTANATEPAWNGYLLTVACSCAVVLAVGHATGRRHRLDFVVPPGH